MNTKKGDKKEESDDEEEKKTIEELIEEERAALPNEGLTRVTLESFIEWKKRKALKKQKELEDKMKDEIKKTGGKGTNVLSGRALFTYDPTMFKDDDDAADEKAYEERNNEETKEEESKDIYDGNHVDGNGVDGNGGVDTDLFKYEDGEANNDEEPDFDS